MPRTVCATGQADLKRDEGAPMSRRARGPPGGAVDGKMPPVQARAVATPVLALLAAGPREGAVRGATAAAAYLEFGDFVAALTAPRTPLMPNGVAVPRT